VATHCILLRPDIFKAFGLLNVPYIMRSWGTMSPMEGLRLLNGDNDDRIFYQVYFQDPAVDEEMSQDVHALTHKLIYALSGDAPPDKRWHPMITKSKKLIGSFPEECDFTAWLTQDDVDYIAGEFARTGFRGGLNWYRNIDRNWAMTPFLSEATLPQPSIFITGDADPTMFFLGGLVEGVENVMTGIRKKIIMPGVGHWSQEERPDEVNKMLIEFLKGL
jgi:pimeloyl-ACP methyl ester carboxylesterase